jgi:2,3-bisphosphoglycerate-dependent phosphoglycerate mutase
MRPLSARGRQDAERVASLLVPARPTAIYSSPYRRARQTVEPLAERLGLPIQERSELRERALGDGWRQDWEAAIRPTWVDFHFAYPDGETNAEAEVRARAVYEELVSRHRGQSLVVASHGNLIVLMLHHLDAGFGFELWRSLTLPDVYELEADLNGGVELRRLW